MARKKRDTSKKRASIIDAAIQAFQEDGYDNTSMDRIADVAGASKRTVYNHFPSKDALFQAVIERFMTESREAKQIAYDPDRSLAEQLSDFADAKLDALTNPAWRGFLKVGLSAMFRDPELATGVMGQAEVGARHLEAWLEAATEDGRLRVTDPALSAQVFWGMVSGALFWPQALGGTLDPEVETVLRAELIQTFLARYAPASAPFPS